MQNLTQNPPENLDNLIFQDNVYIEVIGDERPGRVRGLGLGLTPTTYFGSASTHHRSSSKFSTSIEELQQLKANMAKNLAEHKAMLEAQMEERMAENKSLLEAQMEEKLAQKAAMMDAKLEEFMKKMELRQASSSNNPLTKS